MLAAMDGKPGKRSALLWIVVLLAVVVVWWFLRPQTDQGVSAAQLEADRVARHTAGAVVVDGRTLEVSRKYRDSVRAAIPESAPSARVRHISNDKPS